MAAIDAMSIISRSIDFNFSILSIAPGNKKGIMMSWHHDAFLAAGGDQSAGRPDYSFI
jgi:hypothetical protein